jgi:DNA-binding transcriptional ArsR family regulator
MRITFQHSNILTLVNDDALRRFKAGVFQVLAHPTRIHIVEELASGEQSVSTLLKSIPVEQANLSQHLSLLRSRGLVLTRRERNQVFYRLRDEMLPQVLLAMRKHFASHLEESLELLKTLESTR